MIVTAFPKPGTRISKQTCCFDEEFVERVKEVTLRLYAYCRKGNWSGYDPYDALNSPIFRALPTLNRPLLRIATTQVLKRSPFNVRRLLGIPVTQNPKAIALFLAASLKLNQIGLLAKREDLGQFIDLLSNSRSKDVPYWCWGYSFPWQTRTVLVPRGAANLVCTTFVANALLDAYETVQESRCLEMAVSASDYLLDALYWTDGGAIAGFGYPVPYLKSLVHNANLLGAALLCRVGSHTGDNRYYQPALKVARTAARFQRPDGSWLYGEAKTQQWIDNFHTGYNLCALCAMRQYTKSDEFDIIIKRGFRFYCDHFFREDGAARYFHNATYPIDAHSVAQSILTLVELAPLNKQSSILAASVFEWAMANLWSGNGYFYYQKRRFGRVKISYMRWTQAWMLLASASLLKPRATASGFMEDGEQASLCT